MGGGVRIIYPIRYSLKYTYTSYIICLTPCLCIILWLSLNGSKCLINMNIRHLISWRVKFTRRVKFTPVWNSHVMISRTQPFLAISRTHTFFDGTCEWLHLQVGISQSHYSGVTFTPCVTVTHQNDVILNTHATIFGSNMRFDTITGNWDDCHTVCYCHAWTTDDTPI